MGADRKSAVRALHCAACGAPPPSECNHVTFGRGVGQKAPDDLTFPLCMQCHRDWHAGSGRFKGWSKARRRGWQEICLTATNVALQTSAEEKKHERAR